MKEKKKLRLEAIKIQSFVTSLGVDERGRINAGNPAGTEPVITCPASPPNTTCQNTPTCQTECNCETLDCPSYICEESVTCN